MNMTYSWNPSTFSLSDPYPIHSTPCLVQFIRTWGRTRQLEPQGSEAEGVYFLKQHWACVCTCCLFLSQCPGHVSVQVMSTLCGGSSTFLPRPRPWHTHGIHCFVMPLGESLQRAGLIPTGAPPTTHTPWSQQWVCSTARERTSLLHFPSQRDTHWSHTTRPSLKGPVLGLRPLKRWCVHHSPGPGSVS